MKLYSYTLNFSKLRLLKNTKLSSLVTCKHRFFSKENENDLDIPMNYHDVPSQNIRNFSIIAHVDHGKSTLADRILEITNTINIEDGKAQILDRLQVEKERGITVKAQTASLFYKSKTNDQLYLLNLIDTPGHVDFSNEVSRSLSACQGVVLLVDANQGVQAQTVANFYLAFCQNLVIIPVLNKVDLKNANPKKVEEQLQGLFEIKPETVLKISAKHGTGVDNLLEAIVSRLPAPITDREASFKALIFDSWFDKYRGAVIMIFVQNGSVKEGDVIVSVHSQITYPVKNVGILRPTEHITGTLVGGQVGFLTCNMRSAKEACIGDTLHLKDKPVEPFPGFKPAQPMVFAGLFPIDQSMHGEMKNALERLTLNDSAVSVATESSAALGLGWRLGFLGLLHLDVFSQRLEQEYNAQAVMTAPSVTYKARVNSKKIIDKYGSNEFFFSNPVDFPDPTYIEALFEPIILGTIITPDQYLGDVLSLCMDKRGIQKSSTNIDDTRILLQCYLPLNEIVVDFHDTLKSLTSGFGSFDYEDHGYQESYLTKIDILLNGNVVEELGMIAHASKAVNLGRRIVLKLVELIPRQQFQIAIQAAVKGKVIARENIKPFRKDVTSKLCGKRGGDITRKMKLLKQQSEAKKKMKMVGNIEIPRDTFINVLKR
ncbi:translation factor GUF1 homolog, mitochondrial isoform X1 [Daktulosphaira vitifoliae]|uniref:translation factor GUF1 homolog, mitochondrial isoform X1 n=1 Tax=Daktulosphaira vitifoliae TaxID=58002 RepID=UPI0021AB0068|nr:translation factor GUF1 homolog, mitochondrial isoform X1 [Daktulosphaira vitifoliae]